MGPSAYLRAVLAVHDPASRSFSTDVELRPGSWIDVVAPTEAERARLVDLGVPASLIIDALDTDELARVEHHPSGARLFVLRVPVQVSATTEVVPVGIITLPGDGLVTVASVDTGLAAALAAAGSDARLPSRFVLEIALRVAERFVATLHAVEADIARHEAALREALVNDEILALLGQQKRLVLLDEALAADQLVVERALSDARIELEADERVLAEDVLVELRQACTMTRTKKELLGETMDALATVVSNNLNVAMKQLASLTLLVAVPAMFAGLYGMNVALPFAEQPWAFVAVVAISLVVVALIAVLLRARRWL